MKNVLLLGNGINRITKGYSWEVLIEELITKFCNEKVNHDNNYGKPFPLLYEEILSYALMNGTGTESDIKHFIKEKTEAIELNDTHSLINNPNFVDILTTNYDELIEQTLGIDLLNLNVRKVEEQKYSLCRRNKSAGIETSVWHIHGEAKNPNTITLGYEQYAGTLANIRTSINEGNKWKSFELGNLQERLKSNTVDTWIDYFFSHNVHIVGLSLDFSEIDLWWLLVYRARIKNNYSMKVMGHRINNNIYFYHTDSPTHNITEKNKLEILNSLGILTVQVKLNENNWIDYYEQLFNKELKV